MSPHVWAVFVASFLASSVEFVEAFTIVLVIGVTVNWKSSLAGAGIAVGAGPTAMLRPRAPGSAPRIARGWGGWSPPQVSR